MMLHGCSQNADQFRQDTRMNRVAAEEGFAVIYPDQYNGRNSYECWNWFHDSNTTRGNSETAVIAGMAPETIEDGPPRGRAAWKAASTPRRAARTLAASCGTSSRGEPATERGRGSSAVDL